MAFGQPPQQQPTDPQANPTATQPTQYKTFGGFRNNQPAQGPALTPSQPGTYTGPTVPTNGQTVTGYNPNGTWTPNANEAPPTGLTGYQRTSRTPSDDQIQGAFQKATATLGRPDLKDHTAIQNLSTALSSQGYDTQLGPVDKYGRMDSLFINGQMYRVFDSSGNWNLTSNSGGTAWGDLGPNGLGADGGGGGAAGAGGAGGGGGSSSGFSASNSFNVMDPRANDLYNMLMAQATQTKNINAKDPIIANQVNNYAAQQERGNRKYLAEQAESVGPNSNLNAESRMAHENAQQNTGTMQAQLMQNELGARRQEISQALQEMGSLLTDQERIALSQQLGQIDAALRQQQINSQNDQFAADYGLQANQQANYWDWMRSGGNG